MNINDMLKALPAPGKKEPLQPLETVWGEKLDTDHVLEEYPRPQLVRDHFEILNGYWRYAITDSGSYPKSFDGLILVPFSPESSLSGVGRQLMPHEYLWYERVVEVSDFSDDHRCLLHFEAVDQCAIIYINGRFVKKHMGGYLPFEVDATDFLGSGRKKFKLTVCVQDFSDASYHSRGKQKLNRGGMFYTAQSGIWQTVWLEVVPKHYITRLEITPDFDHGQIAILVMENHPVARISMNIRIFEPTMHYRSEKEQHTILLEQASNTYNTVIELPSVKGWTPDTPYIYPVEITLGEDRVNGYFAMRCFTIEKDGKNIPRVCLNHEPMFINGVLDQGYWPDGLYTAPADDALIYDIRKMKQLGFNMLRKHLKIECRRWYYHCDRYGMLVWQDMVNGGGKYSSLMLTYLPTLLCASGRAKKSSLPKKMYDTLNATAIPAAIAHFITSRKDARGRAEFMEECVQTVSLLKAFPSIMAWVPFNEGWGQFDTLKVETCIREQDGTRLIDHASGWFDRSGGDFKSIHNYFFKLHTIPDRRAFVISEYGGYTFSVRKHCQASKTYGYSSYSSYHDYEKDVVHLLTHDIPKLIDQGLCGAVYTQLSDVEEEVNGLLTFDRKVCKLSHKAIRYIERRHS